MSPRLRGALVPLALAAVSLASGLSVAHGQALPPPPAAAPAPPGTGPGELLSDPAKWLTAMFNGALDSLGREAAGSVVNFLRWVTQGGPNVVNATPPALSYANPAVRDLSRTLTLGANGGLGVIAAWGGINLMVNRHIRTPYHGVLELLPRVLLSGLMLNNSLAWGRFVIDLNNAVCQDVGAAAAPIWDSLGDVPSGGSLLVNLIAMGVYLVMGMLLVGQMLMRLALVDALLVIAPLALLCWALPQTYGWARLWFSTFFGAVFVQSIQAVVLRLGAELIGRLPSMLPALATDPIGQSQVWLMTLMLGIAVLQLTRRVPRLIPGLPMGGFSRLPWFRNGGGGRSGSAGRGSGSGRS